VSIVFTGYTGVTFAPLRFTKQEAAALERHYIKSAKDPDNQVVQTKVATCTPNPDRVTRMQKHMARVISVMDGEMSTREVSEASGISVHVAREVLNKGAGTGVLIKNRSAKNVFRYSLAQDPE